MSPENSVMKKPSSLKDKRKYLYSALDECVKIIDSLEKQQQVLKESKKITEKTNLTEPNDHL